MVNISIRGCKIQSHPPAPQEACLRLEFVAAEGEPPIQVEGAVVRSAVGTSMGLECLKIRPEEEGRLRRVIEAQLLGLPN